MLVVDGVCVLRYDNETGKGDRRHIKGAETSYAFTNCERLLGSTVWGLGTTMNP